VLKSSMNVYVGVYYLVLLAVTVCTLLFQHPGVCLLRVKVSVLFIFDEKIKLMTLKVIYHIALLILEQ
jgi:hypothetical protein